MRRSMRGGAVALLWWTTIAVIAPDYYSLMWKFEDGNFWAPLGLNTITYALESPAGSAPQALNKRESEGAKGTQYLPCTVLTLDGDLSATALNSKLDEFRSAGDDVWSDEQVCIALWFSVCLPFRR